MQVDFYILSTGEIIPFTCRLLEKAYQEQHRVFVYTDSADSANTLNNALWTFRDISFVPHRLSSDAGMPIAPITIGHIATSIEDADILLTTTTTLPNNYLNYQRIIFVVPNQDNLKQQARKEYTRFKNEGHPVQVHNL